MADTPKPAEKDEKKEDAPETSQKATPQDAKPEKKKETPKVDETPDAPVKTQLSSRTTIPYLTPQRLTKLARADSLHGMVLGMVNIDGQETYTDYMLPNTYDDN